MTPPPTAGPTSLERAAREAARLSGELLDLHRALAPAAAADPEVRAAWYRLEDAARTCRRAAETFDPDAVLTELPR